LIREWRRNTWVEPVRTFLDVGDDNNDAQIGRYEGLRNELSYFYVIGAFADSVPSEALGPVEARSETLLAIPRSSPTNYSENPVSLIDQAGFQGQVSRPEIVITNAGNFRRVLEGHRLLVTVTTGSTGTEYVLPITVRDEDANFISTYVFNPGCRLGGDSANPGARQGPFRASNVFLLNAFDLLLHYSFEQKVRAIRLDTAIILGDGVDTPVFFSDTVATPLVGLRGDGSTLGESMYEIEFLPGGIDTVNLQQKRIYKYLNVRVSESISQRELAPGTISNLTASLPFNQWTITRFAYNIVSSPNAGGISFSTNKYYYSTSVDSVTSWEFSNVVAVENARVVIDYAGKGRAPGRNWPRADYKAAHDFEAGDRLQIHIRGGARGPFPYAATFVLQIDPAQITEPTSEVMDGIRIVPNPYLIRHEAQRSVAEPSLRFDYLPEECEIKIFTIGLDLVRTLQHQGGPVEYWDLLNDTGHRVASQIFIARISATNGTTVVKKFSVIIGDGQ
jgi:hypothetical protein